MNDERMKNMYGEDIHVSMLKDMNTKVVSLNEFIKITSKLKRNCRILDNFEAIINKYKQGDQILWYRSSEEDWQRLQGSEGYALIRNEYFIADVVTRMN